MNNLYKNLYNIQKTSANGQCLFNSIVGYLHYEKYQKILKIGDEKEFTEAYDLRQQVAGFIQRNPDEYINEIDFMMTFKELIEQDNNSFKNYITQLEKYDFWAGETEILAASRLLKRPILVYIDDPDSFDKFKLGCSTLRHSEQKPILLYHFNYNGINGLNHYEYLIKKNQNFCDDIKIKPINCIEIKDENGKWFFKKCYCKKDYKHHKDHVLIECDYCKAWMSRDCYYGEFTAISNENVTTKCEDCRNIPILTNDQITKNNTNDLEYKIDNINEQINPEHFNYNRLLHNKALIKKQNEEISQHMQQMFKPPGLHSICVVNGQKYYKYKYNFETKTFNIDYKLFSELFRINEIRSYWFNNCKSEKRGKNIFRNSENIVQNFVNIMIEQDPECKKFPPQPALADVCVFFIFFLFFFFFFFSNPCISVVLSI